MSIDRFNQAEVPSLPPGGFGIGGVIARHKAELHHGTIKVASAGETVTLPLATSAQLNNDHALLKR